MKRLNYKLVEGYQTERPKTVDITSSDTKVYLRRNIEEVANIDEDGNETDETHWEYEEATLTPEEYETYLSELESPSTLAIMQTLADLQLQIDELEI